MLQSQCKLYPLHGVLIVGQVVEAERNPGCCNGRSRDLQKFLHPSMSNKLCSKLLMQQK